MPVGEQVFVTVNTAGRDVGQVKRAQPTGFLPISHTLTKPSSLIK